MDEVFSDAASDVSAAASADACPGAASTVPAVGTRVVAYYHANSNPKGFRYVHVATASVSPLAGLSAGWLPGIVIGTSEEAGAAVPVLFEGPFCDSYQGQVDGIEMQVPAKLVLPRGPKTPPVGPVPLLSLLCVRWWDYWSAQWSSDYNVTSDKMVMDTFDGPCGPSESLPGEHEVHTVFIRRSEDLASVSEQWACLALRGKHRVAWYFLWPTAVQTGTGASRPGCVNERDFFAMAQRMERAGIRSGWPHPSQLYRLLCGKLWVPQMCLNRNYCVPPTTRVHFQEFQADPENTAEAALERLQTLRQEIWNEEPELRACLRGVVKLGFSWQGKDVRPFVGSAGLVKALRELFSQPSSQQLVCLVQQMIPKVACELRILVVRDEANRNFKLQKAVYMALWDKGDKYRGSTDDFAMASGKVLQTQEAADAFFGGDVTACLHAENEAETLVRRWLLWFCTEFGAPSMARLDFLVTQAEPGQPPTVWTCEVTECGSSLCNYEVGGRNAAVLNFALRHEPREDGRFPRKLPDIIWHRSTC